MKKIGIKDIAKHTGYAVSTISKALRNDRTISKDVRIKIIKAATEMSYEPNRVAQALSRKPIIIGVVLPSYPKTIHDEILKGINDAEKKYKEFNVEFIILPYYYDGGSNDEEQQYEKLPKTINALIVETVSSAEKPSKSLKRYNEKNVPIITLIANPNYIKRVAHVSVGGHIVGETAAQLIYKSIGNDTVIGIISGLSNIGIHNENIEGCRSGAKKYNLLVIEVFYTDDTYNMVYETTEYMINLHPEIKGLFVTTFTSKAVCDCLENYGRKDIAVVAVDVDNESVSLLKNKKIEALIYQNHRKQGETAAELAVSAVSSFGINSFKRIEIKTEIVISSNVVYYE